MGTKAFSQVVKEAKEAGYTEPDPRDDLAGTDVARKVFADKFRSLLQVLTPVEISFFSFNLFTALV